MQNSFFMVYAVYYYLSSQLDICDKTIYIIVDWLIYGLSVLISLVLARKQTFNLLVISFNLMISTGYMSEMFNENLCTKGAWTKSYMTVSFVTSVLIAFYAIAVFAMKNKKPTEPEA